MATLLDELREQLSEVENAWLFFFIVLMVISIIGGITLYAVYVYTKP